jgi:chromosome segregation ATPase
MLDFIVRAKRFLPTGYALGLAALIGWSGFAYSKYEASTLRAERDEALGSLKRLQHTAGELSQVEAKLAASRIEYGRTVQAWSETRTRLGMTQQELAILTKRLDQVRERVSQTGSIRQPGPKGSSPRMP